MDSPRLPLCYTSEHFVPHFWILSPRLKHPLRGPPFINKLAEAQALALPQRIL